MPQQLDWTLGDAPELDEPPAEPSLPSKPTPPKPRRTAQWRVGWLTLALIVLALAALGAYSLWTKQAVNRDLRRMIAAEETAGRAGDAAALQAIGDPADAAWRATLAQLASAQQAAPLPSAVLQPVPGAADRIVFTSLAPDEVRADVTRSYRAPDGTTLAFALPQFYRFTQKQWHHIAPPNDGLTTEFWRGHYVSIADHAADADFVVNDLGPYLDDVVGRACDVWTCPRGAFIGVALATDFSAASQPSVQAAPSTAPLLFDFVRGTNPLEHPGNPNLLASAVLVPSPELSGYPADAASAAWLRRAIGLQTLYALANHIARPIPADHHANAFLLALVVRMGARLGLEAPSALSGTATAAGAQPASSELATNLNLMWNLGQVDGHGQPLLGYRAAGGTQFGPDNPGAWDAVLGAALDITNWILRDQPPESDGNLLRGVASDPDQTTWLANALGITQEAAWARWQLAEWQLNHPVGQPELALDCNYGAGLLTLGQSGPVYFLPWPLDTFASAQGMSFSPDGKWLIGDNANAIVAINSATGSVVQLAPPAPNDSIAFRGWVSNTVIAYVHEIGGTPLLSSVEFFDLSNPQRTLPTLANVQDYSLSPDKKMAVIVAAAPQTPTQIVLEVIPALGGTPTVIDAAAGPDLQSSLVAWSRDGRLLSYAHADSSSGTFSLRVTDPAHTASHEVMNSLDVSLNGAMDGFIAWSPTGQQIGFALRQADQARGAPMAFGLTNVDGSGLTLLRQQNGFYTQLGWSADGDYLAATNYDSADQSTQTGNIEIFDSASKLEINELVNSWSFAWSPQGHQLVNLHNPVQLFPEPTSSAPQILSTDACSTAAWQPQP